VRVSQDGRFVDSMNSDSLVFVAKNGAEQHKYKHDE